MSNTQIQRVKLDEQVLNELFPIERELVVISKQGKKFADYSNDEKKELAKTLMRLSYFVGIKEAPTIDQLKMLVPFLIMTFPNMNIHELEHSFNIYCGGQMEQIEHYQNFSPIFISKIIKQYSELQNQARYKANKISQRIQDELETAQKQKEYNPLQGAYESLLIEFENFLKNKYADPDEIQKYKSYFCMKVCHSANLFVNTDCNLDSVYFFDTFFKTIDKDNYQQQIKNYVRSNGKTF